MNRKVLDALVVKYAEEQKFEGRGIVEIREVDGYITAVGVLDLGDWVFEIPEFVESIGEGLFEGISRVREVILHEGVKIIGDRAFSECGVRRLKLPDSIEYIGERAFYRLNGVELRVPKNIQYIGLGAYSFSGIKGVNIEGEQVYVMRDAFLKCANLSEVFIGKGVRDMGVDTFMNCHGLKKVEIEDGAAYIGRFAFNGCKGISEIIKPENYGEILI